VRVEYFDPAGEPFELSVVGEHNQIDAQAAWAAARPFGATRAQAAAALKAFAGLEHRLQFVAEIAGVRYFNDSKCTTPQGAIVALESFAARSAVMIVGGYDKHVSFDELGAALAARAKAVVTVGATAGTIATATKAAIAAKQPGSAAGRTEATIAAQRDSAVGQAPTGAPAIIPAGTFEQAVALARQAARPGDAVVLSPACASYDMFDNYEQRGERFVELVKKQ
jgi:UDP-N-acetylmuramoylalanine--D-glutamate ligase